MKHLDRIAIVALIGSIHCHIYDNWEMAVFYLILGVIMFSISSIMDKGVKDD